MEALAPSPSRGVDSFHSVNNAVNVSLSLSLCGETDGTPDRDKKVTDQDSKSRQSRQHNERDWDAANDRGQLCSRLFWWSVRDCVGFDRNYPETTTTLRPLVILGYCCCCCWCSVSPTDRGGGRTFSGRYVP